MYPQKSFKLKTPSITEQIRTKEEEQRLRAKAYEIWEKRGKTGTPEENWNAAIASLKREQNSQALLSVWRWTGLKEKKGWDIVQLLASFSIPVAVFLGGQYFTAEKAGEERLNKYLDTMGADLSDLTTGNNSTKKVIDTIRTSATLNALDGDRKRQLLLFLKGSNLIEHKEPNSSEKKLLAFISLNSANLSKANLNNADLSDTDLSGANLKSAHLKGANLSNVNFTNAVMQGAELDNAVLVNAVQQKIIFCHTTMPNGAINDTGCPKGGGGVTPVPTGPYVSAVSGILIRQSPAGAVIGSLGYSSSIKLTGNSQFAGGRNWLQLTNGGWIAEESVEYR